MRKRLTAILLTICLLFTLATGVSALDMRANNDFYLKQQTSVTCTLTSAAMMMRRRACLDGLENWTDITESSLRRVAWSYVGLSHDFSMLGITVLHSAFESGTSVESQLISLLKTHPEGIVVYNRRVPHAILVTDYTDGVFYCADPSTAAPSGRIPVSEASISISNANFYWYVASDANGAAAGSTLTARKAAYPAKLRTGSSFELSGTLSTAGAVTHVTVSLLNDSGKAVQSAAAEPDAAEYDLAELAGQLDFAALAPGSYTFCLLADDDRGGHIRLKKTMLVSAAETVAADYSGSVPSLTNINAVNLTQNGFDVEADASDPDGAVSTVLYSTWADGSAFGQGLIGTRSGGTFTASVEADIAGLGIRSFMVNITAMDTDGNYAKAALLVRVSPEELDPENPEASTDITPDQLLL